MATYCITNTDVYRACGLASNGPVSSADVDLMIPEAIQEASRLLNVPFSSDGSTFFTATDEYYDGNSLDTFRVKNKPLQVLSSLAVSTDYGTTWTSITVSKVWTYSNSGLIKLKPTAEYTYYPDFPQSIKTSYTYGKVANSDEKRFISMLCGLMALANQIGGTYNKILSFGMPELTGTVGDQSQKIKATLEELRQQINLYIEHYPKNMFVA